LSQELTADVAAIERAGSDEAGGDGAGGGAAVVEAAGREASPAWRHELTPDDVAWAEDLAGEEGAASTVRPLARPRPRLAGPG
jgi:hypothetical protein